MTYFSDKELGERPRNDNKISIAVWNGIVGVVDRLISNNALSRNFPVTCPDFNSEICGYDKEKLKNRIVADIPNLKEPFLERKEPDKIGADILPLDNLEKAPDTYDILDYIEFIYKNLIDAKNENYHDYYKHHHLSFAESNNSKVEFKKEINDMFSRNDIAYILQDNGEIKRFVPHLYQNVLTANFTTRDEELNTLLNKSIHLFLRPQKGNLNLALEKLWDAFERLKTYVETDKRNSTKTIITILSEGNTSFETELENEFLKLTEIGNNFAIRHFETNKTPITSEYQVECLYYRMFSLINLFLQEERAGKINMN